MLRWTRSELWPAVLFTIMSALSWWRASQGRPGWKEMSIVWTIGAVVNWGLYFRAKRKRARGLRGTPPPLARGPDA